MAGRHVLVLGGARSGKTSFAERLAIRAGDSPLYLATADTLDAEMRERIAIHKRLRSGKFASLEEPLQLPDSIVAASASHDVILVDRVTLWIANLLDAGEDVAKAVDQLAVTLAQIKRSRVVLISNEVGLGVEPDNPLERNFRDLAGSTHQRLAEICADVYFVAAGLPMTLKGERRVEGLRPPVA